MKRLAAAATLVLLAGCPRGDPRKPTPEPVARPVPVEIDWPDAGVGSDRDQLSPR
jgi:hypothetical protein